MACPPDDREVMTVVQIAPLQTQYPHLRRCAARSRGGGVGSEAGERRLGDFDRPQREGPAHPM